MNLDESTVLSVIDKMVTKIPPIEFSDNKLGGPGFIVQIDETMMNYKCKSHRGRSPTNRTDALCMVEVLNGIERVYA
ncbi:hypothetical protein COBT_002304, partial [Conglomerata obtusa]